MISADSVLVILGMLMATYSTRLIGFFALRNRTLGKRAAKVMDAAPGCVLIAVAVTVLAASRLPMLPTVLIAVVSAGILGHLMG